MSDWLNEVIGEDLIAEYEGHYGTEDAVIWLRQKPRTIGELRSEEIDWLRWMAAKLSQDSDLDVRMWVACNPMTPQTVLWRLAEDEAPTSHGDIVFVDRLAITFFLEEGVSILPGNEDLCRVDVSPRDLDACRSSALATSCRECASGVECTPEEFLRREAFRGSHIFLRDGDQRVTSRHDGTGVGLASPASDYQYPLLNQRLAATSRSRWPR